MYECEWVKVIKWTGVYLASMNEERFFTILIKNICNISHIATCTTVFLLDTGKSCVRKAKFTELLQELVCTVYTPLCFNRCCCCWLLIDSFCLCWRRCCCRFRDHSLLLQRLVFNHKYGHFPTIHHQLIIHTHCSYLRHGLASSNIMLRRAVLLQLHKSVWFTSHLSACKSITAVVE